MPLSWQPSGRIARLSACRGKFKTRGILHGKNGNIFDPKGTASREEATQMMLNLKRQLVKRKRDLFDRKIGEVFLYPFGMRSFTGKSLLRNDA